MNNQEAINLIKLVPLYRYECDLEKGRQSELFKALNKAIEALEKQIAKEPVLCMSEKSGMFVDYADGHSEYKVQMNNWWRCPYCHSIVGQMVIVHEHVHNQHKKKYCEKCGQLIDWT